MGEDRDRVVIRVGGEMEDPLGVSPPPCTRQVTLTGTHSHELMRDMLQAIWGQGYIWGQCTGPGWSLFVFCRGGRATARNAVSVRIRIRVRIRVRVRVSVTGRGRVRHILVLYNWCLGASSSEPGRMVHLKYSHGLGQGSL